MAPETEVEIDFVQKWLLTSLAEGNLNSQILSMLENHRRQDGTLDESGLLDALLRRSESFEEVNATD